MSYYFRLAALGPQLLAGFFSDFDLGPQSLVKVVQDELSQGTNQRDGYGFDRVSCKQPGNEKQNNFVANYVARALEDCSEPRFIWFCHVSLQFLCCAKHFQGFCQVLRVGALKGDVIPLGWMNES